MPGTDLSGSPTGFMTMAGAVIVLARDCFHVDYQALLG